MDNRFMLTPFFIDRAEPGLEAIVEPGWEVNRVALPEGSQQERLVAVHRPLADFVARAAQDGKRPVSIAGDCCTSIAVLAGLQRAGISPTLIWFDAHGDFNTWETTPSGFLGGMPLAMVVGRGEQTMVEGVGLTPIAEEKVILTDARDLDPGEREAVAESGLTHLRSVQALLDSDLPAGPLYVHFDSDVVDSAEVPAMNYPTPGGPSAQTMGEVFRYLADSGRVVAVSVSGWAPRLDQERATERVVMALVGQLVGASL